MAKMFDYYVQSEMNQKVIRLRPIKRDES